MKNISDVRQSVWNHFVSSTPVQFATFKEKFFLGTKPLKAIPASVRPIGHFSEFNEEHLGIARDIWTELFRIANDATKNDVDAVSDAISHLTALQQNPDLKNYALMVFIAHNERAKRILRGTIPSLGTREPQKVLPSSAPAFHFEESGEEATGASFKPGGTTDPAEDELNYFREDPAFNEHHERWHVVYPNGGIPYTDPITKNVLYRERDRHGEMFIYMHQQMIAHYDANRLAKGLKKVIPFDFSTPIAVGYDPGTFVQVFGDTQYSPRLHRQPASFIH
jgi:tyrosinase